LENLGEVAFEQVFKEGDVDQAKMLGQVLTAMGYSHFFNIIDTMHAKGVEWTHYSTAIALRLYEMDHQLLPQNLDALIPDYLDKIPEDPFNYYRPIQYLPNETHYILYSIGVDRIDQKGLVEFQWTRTGDVDPNNKDGDIVLKMKPAG